ncbi:MULTISPECIES: hypothetical protein [Helcococcus]|uniref:Uncharacterized protein n=1 Tax=Helcococcus bovis TaxID=3153252 RepID=A0ABW9F881_9FIRM
MEEKTLKPLIENKIIKILKKKLTIEQYIDQLFNISLGIFFKLFKYDDVIIKIYNKFYETFDVCELIITNEIYYTKLVYINYVFNKSDFNTSTKSELDLINEYYINVYNDISEKNFIKNNITKLIEKNIEKMIENINYTPIEYYEIINLYLFYNMKSISVEKKDKIISFFYFRYIKYKDYNYLILALFFENKKDILKKNLEEILKKDINLFSLELIKWSIYD